MVEEKPVAAYTLSLIGLAPQAVGAIFFTYGMFYGWGGGFRGSGMMMGGPWSGGFLWSPLPAMLAIVVVALGVLGVLWMNTADVSRVRTGSTMVLVASIIAFPTMFGFIIGSLLMLIGGILGLTWQSAAKEVGGEA